MNPTITPETVHQNPQQTRGFESISGTLDETAEPTQAKPEVKLSRFEDETFRSIVKGLGDVAAERVLGIPPAQEYEAVDAMANPASFDDVVAPAHIRRQQAESASGAQQEASFESRGEKLSLRTRLRKLGNLAITKVFGIPSSDSAYYQEGFDRRSERPEV